MICLITLIGDACWRSVVRSYLHDHTRMLRRVANPGLIEDLYKLTEVVPMISVA